MRNIISAVKVSLNLPPQLFQKYQAEAANANSTGPVPDPVIVEEHLIDSADSKSVELASEPQDTGVAQSDYSGQRKAGLVGPQNERKDLALKQEEVLYRNFNPPNIQQSTSGASGNLGKS